MTNLTYAALLALPDSEQLLSERIAIICEGEKCGEDEARARRERRNFLAGALTCG